MRKIVTLFLFVLVLMVVGCSADNIPQIWNPPKAATIGVLVTEEVFPRPQPTRIEIIVNRPPDPQVQTAIVNQLIRNGYNVRIFHVGSSELVDALGNPAKAAVIAAKQGIDILIIGEAFAEYAGEKEGMTIFRSLAEIKGISTNDGKVLFSASMSGTGRDLSDNIAAKKALHDAGESISGLVTPSETVKFALACNIVQQENFPKNFTERYLGWLWLNEMEDKIINELPDRYRERSTLLLMPTSTDIDVSNRRADILAQNPEYMLFFEVTSLKAKWYPDNKVDYTIEVKYQIIERQDNKVIKTGTVQRERHEFEPLFYRTSATIESYYNSRFRGLLKDVANELYIEMSKDIMDLIDSKEISTDSEYTLVSEGDEQYITTVTLMNGEQYTGTLYGVIPITSLSETTVQIDPKDISTIEWLYGEIFKVTLKNGSVIKGNILLPDITVNDSLIGPKVIKIKDIKRMDFEVKTY